VRRRREGVTAPVTGVVAAPGVSGLALPAWLAALVNPAVLAEREPQIIARLGDDVAERVRRRRCAEVVATHLIEVHTRAQNEDVEDHAA
jgi:hypothetical protein